MYGAFAEEVAVAAAGLAPIPDGIDDRTAAAFGVAYRTAYHTLRSAARVRSDDEVIVLGAGGGVGLAAVQLAVHLGASVTAIASSEEKLDVASSYGARRLVNHRSGVLRDALRERLARWRRRGRRSVGGPLSEPALRSLRRGGRFVTVGFASGDIPRIPLKLGTGERSFGAGLPIPGCSAGEFSRNEEELRDHLISGAGATTRGRGLSARPNGSGTRARRRRARHRQDPDRPELGASSRGSGRRRRRPSFRSGTSRSRRRSRLPDRRPPRARGP